MRVHRITLDLIQYTTICDARLMQTPSLNTNTTDFTVRSSLRCVSAAEHHTAEQYFKTGRTKPRKHLPRSNLSWNTRLDFLKIPSLWEVAMETERRCFSNVILESNVTPNISRSSDSYCTVPPIVNGGDWGCTVRHLETIMIRDLVTRIQFLSQVTPLTNLPEVTVQGLCYCNSNACWTDSPEYWDSFY